MNMFTRKQKNIDDTKTFTSKIIDTKRDGLYRFRHLRSFIGM
jgi:hypothetical protein